MDSKARGLEKLNGLIKLQENSKSKALAMLDKIKADIEKAKAKVKVPLNVIPLEAGNARAMMNQLVPPFGNPDDCACKEEAARLRAKAKKEKEQSRFKTAADLGYVWEGKEQALREIK